MNSVHLIGRFTKDPEISTSGETTVARFTLAVDRRYSKGDERTDFINCMAFNKKAEFLQKYFKKGMKIATEGEWRTGSYTNKDGQKVYTNECLITECEFVEKKGEGAAEPTKEEDDFMTLSNEDRDQMPF